MLDVVVHTYNPSHAEDIGRRAIVQEQPQAEVEDPIKK
jgi:hypothetical protein